jgi:hypothetical protein
MVTRWVYISCNSFVRTAGAAPLPSVEKAVVCLASLHQTRSLGKSRIPAPAGLRSHFDRRILVVDRDKKTTGSGLRTSNRARFPATWTLLSRKTIHSRSCRWCGVVVCRFGVARLPRPGVRRCVGLRPGQTCSAGLYAPRLSHRPGCRDRQNSYLVDPASSHMLVSKIKPCMSKYKQLYTVKLRTAHYISNNLFDGSLLHG